MSTHRDTIPLPLAIHLAMYAVIGLFHYVFRRRFLEISVDPAGSPAVTR